MNMTTARGWGWLGLLWFVCACGGQVTDEGGEQGGNDGKQDEPGGQSSEGGGPGPGPTGGSICAGTQPPSDYNLCYKTFYPPCLEMSDAGLPARLGVTVRPTIGPWSGTNSDCKMLCCYGMK